MDIKPCQKCGCGSNNEEGQPFPYAMEYEHAGMALFKVACGECEASAVSNSLKDAIEEWNSMGVTE